MWDSPFFLFPPGGPGAQLGLFLESPFLLSLSPVVAQLKRGVGGSWWLEGKGRKASLAASVSRKERREARRRRSLLTHLSGRENEKEVQFPRLFELKQKTSWLRQLLKIVSILPARGEYRGLEVTPHRQTIETAAVFGEKERASLRSHSSLASLRLVPKGRG